VVAVGVMVFSGDLVAVGLLVLLFFSGDHRRSGLLPFLVI
jgi:hypothetical protein